MYGYDYGPSPYYADPYYGQSSAYAAPDPYYYGQTTYDYPQARSYEPEPAAYVEDDYYPRRQSTRYDQYYDDYDYNNNTYRDSARDPYPDREPRRDRRRSEAIVVSDDDRAGAARAGRADRAETGSRRSSRSRSGRRRRRREQRAAQVIETDDAIFVQEERPATPVLNAYGDETKSVWSLALSELTVASRAPGRLPLNLMEEFLYVKAGDGDRSGAKFKKRDPVLDFTVAAALLLEMVIEKKVVPDNVTDGYTGQTRLKLVDNTQTKSRLVNSAIKHMEKQEKKKYPLSVAQWLQKVSGSGGTEGLAQAMLWRLVKKGKLKYAPQSFGTDKYSVANPAELNAVREKVVKAVEPQNIYDTNLRDQLLCFLYYLPRDTTERLLGKYNDPYINEVKLICRAVAMATQDKIRSKSFL